MVKFILKNWILIFILLLGFFLRTYRLDYVELFGDELDAGYQSYSLLVNGTDYKGNWLPAYMHSFSEWRAPGLMYAMVPFIQIFGLNEWGVRMGPAVFGILSIVGFYLLLGQIGVNKRVSLITMLVLAISPWHIQYSRAGFEITLMSAFIVFGLYFLIKKYFVLSAMLLSASIYTYSSANVLMPLLVLLTLCFFKLNIKELFKFGILGLIFCLPILYQLIFGHAGERFGTLNILNNKDVIAEVIEYRNNSNNTFVSKIFYNKYVISAKKIVFNYSNAIGANFLFNEGDVTFRHSLHQVGNLFWIQLPLIIWGLIRVIKNKKYFFIVGVLLIAPIASSLTIDGFNHATRLFLLVFPLAFLTAYGFDNLKYFKWVIVTILIFEFARFQYFYWNFYRDQSWRWWHTGYKQSMQYIAENKDKYEKVIMDNTYEPALIRFLFWNNVDSKLVYNLIDKNNSAVGVFNGFCLDIKYCFVNFEDKFKLENMVDNTLYMISQERNVGGDWDWSKTPPSGITVLKTVRNYQNFPIFYLVIKD